MPDVNVEMIAGQLTRIGLLSRDQYIEAKTEAEGSPQEIIRVCLRKGWLTSWQLEHLKKGDASQLFFGPYRAMFHLAEGTFARVYRGQHTDFGNPVAIKVLRGRFASTSDAVDLFRKEAEAGMRLQHENIVRILDFGNHESKHFIVMEFVEGMNLREFLRLRQRLRGDEALPLMIGLAEGLQYSHEQGVTHRDIKATNILIANSGVAKLVDFGLASLDEDDKTAKSQRTVDYSALERSCGSPKGDPRSDVFFLGCVFYYMLTGKVPLEDSESKDPLKKMLKRSFSSIRPLNEHPNAPDAGLCRIIEKMMKLDLKARYQSMAEVVADLHAYRDPSLNGTDSTAGATADDDWNLDPELDSSIFRNPFLPGGSSEEIATVTQESLDLDLSSFERSDDDVTDLAALLGLRTHSDADESPTAEAPPQPTPAPPPVATAKALAQTLLCVESQPEVQDALKKHLTRKGYRVLLVSDAERAAERYRETPTEAVIFDFDGQGSDAIRHLTDMGTSAEKAKVSFRFLALLSPRQAPLEDQLPTAERRIVLSKPVKLKDVQDALDELAPLD